MTVQAEDFERGPAPVATPPEPAEFVRATQLIDVLEAMAERFREGRPVRFTGHGSKDFYGGPLGDATPLSTQALNG
ncbi:hypothetical protein FUT87_26095, partial [Mitsuaria sp. TWR114]